MNPDTDTEWERWGQREPYFGVITDCEVPPRGVHDRIEEGVLRFGGGARRLRVADDPPAHLIRFSTRPPCSTSAAESDERSLPFARVSRSRCRDGRRHHRCSTKRRANCRSFGADNIELELSDDELLRAPGRFDLVHSFIVFQHIAPERGKTLFARLIQRIAPGGVGAIHVLYSKSAYDASLGVAPASSAVLSLPSSARSDDLDPEMQMNAYGATEVLFLLQRLGVHRVHVEFTDHGGELGLFLFFRAPRMNFAASESRS